MTLIRTRTRVGPDGNVTVPVGAAEAGTEVEVTVAPAVDSAAVTTKPQSSDLINGIPRDEWYAIIERTAGSIDDESFCRPIPRSQISKIEFDD